MGLSRRECLRSAATAAIASAGVPRAAWSQAYPARPVRIIVPFAPGGPNDLAARLVAQKLSEQLGRQFYVENVGGAGGNIGMGQAARAAPDGYTMLAAAPSLVVNPGLYEKVPYDLHRDFEAVTIIASAPTVLTVHPSLPARTLEELVALIRANPGKYSYASPGTGTPPHLVGELFRLSLGLDLVHVAFSSGGLAINSAVAGHTPISFGAMPPAVPLVQDGKLRALAVTSGRRTLRRSRPCASRGGHLDGRPGSGRDAAGDRHPPPSRDCKGSGAPGRAGAADVARLRAARVLVGGVQRPDQGRGREMGARDPRRGIRAQ